MTGMPVTTSAPGPGLAERARIVLAHAPTAVLEVGPDRSVALGVVSVDTAVFAAVVPDPLADGSDDAVTRLLCAHPARSCSWPTSSPTTCCTARTRWSRIDRFGVVMRVDTPAGSRRARLDFPAALCGPAELPAARRELGRRAAQVTACPFTDEPWSA